MRTYRFCALDRLSLNWDQSDNRERDELERIVKIKGLNLNYEDVCSMFQVGFQYIHSKTDNENSILSKYSYIV